jgi:hypothetical protein
MSSHSVKRRAFAARLLKMCIFLGLFINSAYKVTNFFCQLLFTVFALRNEDSWRKSYFVL